MSLDLRDIPVRIANAGQLASLLEVSGYPKTGNVHRTQDFPDVRFEHFLAGSVFMGESLREAAESGVKVGKGEIKSSEVGLGATIRKGVEKVEDSHLGGNTHLGTILLFVPLASASGKTLTENSSMDLELVREDFDLMMRSTTCEDSLEVLDAIQIALDIGEDLEKDESSWLGSADKFADLSVGNPNTREILSEENISLYEWMDVSSGWDGIARELTSKMEASFEVGYPALKKNFEKYGDINMAVVQTFLTILSEYPDTFIARKVGLEETTNIVQAVNTGMKKAQEVSKKAKSILKVGGITTKEGRERIYKLDEYLQESEGKLNPGTTADLTAASLNIALLNGLKY